MSIIKKLIAIQSQLHAPKSQWNKFSSFWYRNQEDILEAVKPLLKEQGLYMSISDDIVMIGTRFYVKATVKIEDEDGSIHEVSAFAREVEAKTGMDGSQITGAASSYARKYCLNGVFAIDDTKDADSGENKEEKKQPDTQKQPVTTKTESQVPTTPKEPIKPKEKAVIVVNNDKYKKAIDYLVSHKDGVLAWDAIKSNYTISEMDQAQLLIEAADKIKGKESK